MKLKIFLFILGLFFVSPFFALANAANLVISQIQITGGRNAAASRKIVLCWIQPSNANSD
jgi:hypothetical protein